MSKHIIKEFLDEYTRKIDMNTFFFNFFIHIPLPYILEDSLACHTYCDTGHPFIIVISEDP